ncbi:MAG: insulinase family protein [Clostridiales bacterium]|nr:insulinase family protein [Clostridiales bacterium]
MTTKKYANGLTVIVDTMPSLRSVTSGIMVGTGSAYETAENNGISHFIEHMLFKGTLTRSAEQIVSGFDDAGATYNAFTGKEYTCFYFKSIDEKTEECFDILCDLFLNSTFDKDELDRERSVVLEEIGMSKDEPDGVCSDVLSRVMYRGSLGMEILGTPENVSRFTKTDIDGYMKAHYIPANTVVAFVGNITEERAYELVEKHLSSFIAAPKKERSDYAVQAFCDGYGDYIHDYEQSELSIAFPSIPFGDEKSALTASLDCLFGGSMSSRLFQRIREKMGLCYSVYTSSRRGKKSGAFTINANVNAKNAVKCVKAIKEEIENLVKNGVTKEEVERAKMQLKVGCLFAKENPMNHMLQLMRWRIIRDADYDIDYSIALIEAASPETVIDHARETFFKKPAVAYVGKDPKAKIADIFNV